MIEILVFVASLKCPGDSGWIPRRFENMTRQTYEMSILLGEELLFGPLVFGAGGGVEICLPREAWTVTKRVRE